MKCWQPLPCQRNVDLDAYQRGAMTIEVVPGHLLDIWLTWTLLIDLTVLQKKKPNEQLFVFAVSVLNSGLCTAGIWFWCGWGHLTQQQGGNVMVWATTWATAGTYTAYFWESLHNCTSCWWPIRKEGSSFSLGKRRDKAARFLLQKKITNRRCRVSLSWSVEVYKRKNKGIVSIKTNLSVVKLLFNELFRCLELLHETAILPYALQYYHYSVRLGYQNYVTLT